MAPKASLRASSRTSTGDRVGCQEPTFHFALGYGRTLAPAAAKLALGVDLDPWQRSVMADWLAVHEGTRRYVHRRCGLEVPRQNGKTALVEARINVGVLMGEKILYTAHDYSTVTQLFDRMKLIWGERAHDPDARNREFNDMVLRVRKGTGKEAIFFRNGAAVYFSTRTKSAKRGFTVDVVICDEAQELTESHLKAMLSTASAGERRNPQYIYVGTPPTPESQGTFFQDVRARVRAGGGEDICWSEWSLEIEDPTKLAGTCDDRDVWYRVNPSLGVRIDEETVMSERETYSEDLSFAQERLGYFLPQGTVERVIDAGAWRSCETARPPAGGKRCFGVKFAPDGSTCALAVCLAPEGGAPYIECIDARPMSSGVGWLAAFLYERRGETASVAVDGRVGTQALVERLLALGYPRRAISTPSASDFAGAVSMLVAAVNERRIEHMGQPALDASATLTRKRRIGSDGFGFESTDEADAVPIEACALAYREAMTTKRNPIRKQVVW